LPTSSAAPDSDQQRASVVSRKYVLKRCAQNGPPPRRNEGAYPQRSVTEAQRQRRAIFHATLRAAVLSALACVAGSTSVIHTQALRSRLGQRTNPSRRFSTYLRDIRL